MLELGPCSKEDTSVHEHDGNTQDMFSTMKARTRWETRMEDKETEASAKSRVVSGDEFKDQANSKDEVEGTPQNPRSLFRGKDPMSVRYPRQK